MNQVGWFDLMGIQTGWAGLNIIYIASLFNLIALCCLLQMYSQLAPLCPFTSLCTFTTSYHLGVSYCFAPSYCFVPFPCSIYHCFSILPLSLVPPFHQLQTSHYYTRRLPSEPHWAYTLIDPYCSLHLVLAIPLEYHCEKHVYSEH